MGDRILTDIINDSIELDQALRLYQAIGRVEGIVKSGHMVVLSYAHNQYHCEVNVLKTTDATLTDAIELLARMIDRYDE